MSVVRHTIALDRSILAGGILCVPLCIVGRGVERCFSHGSVHQELWVLVQVHLVEKRSLRAVHLV